MAITLVQAVSASPALSTTLTLPSATTAGNCVVVCFMLSGRATSQTPSVTAVTLGGVADNFAQAAGSNGGSGASGAYIYADPNCAGGKTAIAWTAGSAVTGVWAYEFSGVQTSPVDKTSAASTAVGAGSTTFTSGTTVTTTQASEVWVGVGGFAGLATTVSVAPASPWINEPSQIYSGAGGLATDAGGGISGYQITSATGTATYSGTLSGTPPSDAGAVATLKALSNVTVGGVTANVNVAAVAGSAVANANVHGVAAQITTQAVAGTVKKTIPGLMLSSTYISTQPPTTAYSAINWTDISTYVETSDAGGQPIQITTGRQDALSDANAATLTCNLDNSAGTFTPGTVNDIGLRKGSWIRQSVTVGGQEYNRFIGFVTSQPVANFSGSSIVTLQAADWLSRLGQGSTLYAAYVMEILTDSQYKGKLVGFWPFNETATAATSGTSGTGSDGFTSAGDLGGASQQLTVVNAGSGAGAQAGAVQFGQDAAPGYDNDGSVTFTPLNAANGQLLHGPLAQNLGTDFTIEFWVQTASTRTMPIMVVADFTAGVQLVISRTMQGNLTVAGVQTTATSSYPTSSTTFDAWIADADWHHVWLQFHRTSSNFYTVRAMVDGVNKGTSPAQLQLTSGLNFVNVGGQRNPAPGITFDGNMYGLAITTSNRSDLPTSHYSAAANGFAGELTSTRLTRLAQYAGISLSWTNFPASSTLCGPQSIQGNLAIDAMRDVARAEMMPIYADTNGKVTMLPRINRVNPTAAFTVHATDLDPGTNTQDDFSYLINEIDVSQPVGTTVKTIGAYGTASQALFGRYYSSLTAAVNSDTDAANLGAWLVYLQNDPGPRWIVGVETATLSNTPGYSTAWRQSVLSAGVNSAITIDQLLSYMPGATGSSVNLFLEGWTETIDAATHMFTFNTSDATLFSGLFNPVALNSNPGLRANVSGWAINSGSSTLTFSTAQQYTYNFGPGVTAPVGTPSGTGAGLLTPDGVVANPFIESTTRVAAVAGQKFTAGAWVFPVSVGHIVEIGINWYNGSGTLISSSVKPFNLNTNKWQYIISPLFTAPANTASATIRVGRNQQYGTVTTFTSGSGNYTAPLTGTARVQVWAAGGGGASNGWNGGAGGEFAENLAFSITNSTLYPYSVGAGGAAGTSPTGQAGTAGGNATFNTSSVVANGGAGGTITTSRPAGGTGSAAPVHFSGGAGGMQTGPHATVSDGGGGGGGSGGPQNPGAQGGDTSTGLSGLGATAVPGGGPGGNGGNYTQAGPSVGFVPATGPGGGGGGGATGMAGAAGANGQIVISPVGAVPPAAALLYINDAELTGPAAVLDSSFLLVY